MIIEINADPTPLTEEGISDFLIQGKTDTILPKIVEEVKKRNKGSYIYHSFPRVSRMPRLGRP